MGVEIKKKEIDLAKCGWNIKEYVLKFLEDNHMLNNENKKNLESIKIYAENLMEQHRGRMISRPGKNPPEIAIDFGFVNDAETITLKKQNQKLIFSQIIHEMLHQISSYKDEKGINHLTGIIKGDKIFRYNVMNEGFTQMITERITGFILSPDSDKNTYYKNIAKIIANTIGDKAVYDSYFNHNYSMDNLLNYVAKNNKFFETLMSQVAILNCHTIDINIKNDIKNLIIKKVCSSIIVPKLKSLPLDKQNEYLSKIGRDIKNDEVFLKQLKHCANKYYKLNNEQLSAKRAEIEKSLSNYNMLINVSTLNLTCPDIGRYQEYLYKQIEPIISFYYDTCKVDVKKKMRFEYNEKIYTLSEDQIKCLIENREKLGNKLYCELYVRKYLMPKQRKKL